MLIRSVFAAEICRRTGRHPRNSRPGISLVIAAVILAALFAIGALAPRNPDFDAFFGAEAWRGLGLPALAISFLLLMALLLIPGAAERVGTLLTRLVSLVPGRLRLPLLLAAAAAAFWSLPTVRLSGDAGATMIRTALGEVYSSNPLTCWIQTAVSRGLDLYPPVAIRLVSVLSGVVFVFGAVQIGRALFPNEPAGKGLTGLILTCGTAIIFFGSIEVYAPLAAALTLYLYLGIRTLRDDHSLAAPAVVLGVAFVLHGSAGLLLPSLALLANHGHLRPIRLRRMLGAGLLFLLPVVATYAVVYFVSWGGAAPAADSERYGSFLGGMDLGPILVLVKTPTNVLHRYAVLDLEHLVGVLNLLFLAAPTGVLLLLLSRGRPKKDPVFGFVATAALFLVLFPNFWNANYSLRFDWDLFSLMGIPLTLMGGMAWFGAKRTGSSPAVGAVAVSLFCLMPVVISNLGTTYEQQMCAMRCHSAMRRALLDPEDRANPGRDLTRRALEYYDAEGRRLDPHGVESRAEWALSLAESGRLEESKARFEEILGDEPEHTGAMEGLGHVLAQLGEFERARVPLLAAITSDPWRLPCRMILARIELQRENLEVAIDQYEKGLRRGCTHPACGQGLFELARLREHAGDIEIAAELDRQAAAR